MDCSPAGSSVHGILQAEILEWVAFSFSRRSSQPRDWIHLSCISSIGRQFLFPRASQYSAKDWWAPLQVTLFPCCSLVFWLPQPLWILTSASSTQWDARLSSFPSWYTVWKMPLCGDNCRARLSGSPSLQDYSPTLCVSSVWKQLLHSFCLVAPSWSVVDVSAHVVVMSLGLPSGKELPASAGGAGDPGSTPGLEDPLEKEMATHSSYLAWKIPWTEELGELQFVGPQRVWHDWACTRMHTHTHTLEVEKHHSGLWWKFSSCWKEPLGNVK